VYEGVAAGSRKHGMFAHGVTYAGHPVCAAVANEALKIYEERDIVGNVRRLAPHFLQRLHALGDHPLVGQSRGVGLIGALEVAEDQAFPGAPAAAVAARIQAAALEQGLIVRTIRDAVAVCPPLIINDAQIDELFDKLGVAFDRALAEMRPATRKAAA